MAHGRVQNSDDAKALMGANDGSRIGPFNEPAARQAIREIFAKHSEEVVFSDELEVTHER